MASPSAPLPAVNPGPPDADPVAIRACLSQRLVVEFDAAWDVALEQENSSLVSGLEAVLCNTWGMAKKGRRATDEERLAAIRMYENGLTADRIVEILEVGRSSVFEWILKYCEGGLAAISTKFASGRSTVLDGSEMIRLYTMINGKDPRGFRKVQRPISSHPRSSCGPIRAARSGRCGRCWTWCTRGILTPPLSPIRRHGPCTSPGVSSAR